MDEKKVRMAEPAVATLLPIIEEKSSSKSPKRSPSPPFSTPLTDVPPPLRESPEATANLFSVITLWWLNPLYVLGAKRQIQQSDLYEMLDEYKSEVLGKQLATKWAEEQAKAKAKGRKPSLVKATIKTFWRRVLPAYICLEIGDACQVGTPLLIQQLLTFLQNSLSSDPAQVPPAWHGYGLAVGMLCLSLFMSTFQQQWNSKSLRTGICLRTALIDLTFTKATRLSSKSHLIYSDGAIVNLMSTDTNRIDIAMLQFLLVFSVPLYTIVVVGMLCRLLGPSALAGAALLLGANPAQAWGMSKLAPLRKKASLFTDARIRLTTEVLQGIKVIKLFGWEVNFLNKLSEIRVQELRLLRKLLTIRAFVAASAAALPVFAAALSIVIFSSVGNALDPDLVFPAIAYFNLLRVPLMILPSAYTGMADCVVALRRIQAYLEMEELDPLPPIQPDHEYAISIENGQFYWDQMPSGESTEDIVHPSTNITSAEARVLSDTDSAKTHVDEFDHPANNNLEIQEMTNVTGSNGLKDINLKIPRGALVAVVGPVGSGKSSLLQAMIGIMPQASGTVVRGATVSYAPQTPWIQNATARNNILFDTPFDQDRYERVVKACNLTRDFESFPDGDQTEIGERGVNMSGGQKARLSLARSVYFGSEILIADDPLSAVDAHVGRALWDNCMIEELSGRTRVIATHQLHVLPEADYVICMMDGRISEQGTYQELMAKQGVFSELMSQYGGIEEDEVEKYAAEKQAAVEFSEKLGLTKPKSGAGCQAGPSSSMANKRGDMNANDTRAATIMSVLRESTAEQDRISAGGDLLAESSEPVLPVAKLMVEEERESGAISTEVYQGYAKTTSYFMWFSILALFILQQVAGVFGNIWITWWTDDSLKLSYAGYIVIYVAWAVLQLILVFIAAFLLVTAINETARIMHEKAFERVIKAPLSFFDQTPLGRILNRFSRDVDTLDSILSSITYEFLLTTAQLMGTFVLIIVVFPWLMIAIVPLLGVYWYIVQYYRSTSREVKRLDSTLRSILYAYFSESLVGLGTLKAYQAVEKAILINQQKINGNNKSYYLAQMGSRWLSIRINVIGATLTFATALVIVITRHSLSPATVGLVLSYLARINGDLNWCVQRFTQLEQNMNSAERMVHYAHNLTTEKPAQIQGMEPPENWPQTGTIEFKNVYMRYRPELPPVLQDVSFKVEPGHKIGVVGRTGAGKSSLIHALFRLVELDQGQIVMDGIETGTMGTLDLRSRIAIIPQDPVLFHGTMRYNLDPLSRHTEQELWTALEASDLKTFVQQQEGGLDAIVADQGENLSVGQRQLVCLSRALLAKSKIVVLDEATASVDMATDTLIQRAIEKDFAQSTIISIAHRLNTVIGFNKILVMDQGRVAEYDSPRALLKDPASIFTSLVDETGPQNSALLRSQAHG